MLRLLILQLMLFVEFHIFCFVAFLKTFFLMFACKDAFRTFYSALFQENVYFDFARCLNSVVYKFDKLL